MTRFIRPSNFLLILIYLSYSFSFSHAETFQLSTIERVETASKFGVSSPAQLVEKEKGKKFIIDFLNSSPDVKYQMTSDRYKRLNRGPEFLKEIFKKVFNKESYDKIDFQGVKLFDQEKQKHLEIKANLYWFLEGYEGCQTIYFMLITEQDRWVLDGLVW